jgi:hypothetical protein
MYYEIEAGHYKTQRGGIDQWVSNMQLAAYPHNLRLSLQKDLQTSAVNR